MTRYYQVTEPEYIEIAKEYFDRNLAGVLARSEIGDFHKADKVAHFVDSNEFGLIFNNNHQHIAGWRFNKTSGFWKPLKSSKIGKRILEDGKFFVPGGRWLGKRFFSRYPLLGQTSVGTMWFEPSLHETPQGFILTISSECKDEPKGCERISDMEAEKITGPPEEPAQSVA